MIRAILLLLILAACTSCSELALIGSGTSLAVSQNAYARVYSGVDLLTIMQTQKDIKMHAYEAFKKERVNENH